MINIEKLNTENPKAFWAELNKLGPRKKENIPLEVYDSNGNVTSTVPDVLNKWNGEFQNLFQGYDKNHFDQEYYTYAQQQRREFETFQMNDSLNAPIVENEIQKVLNKAKCNKAVGIDNLPYEIMKNSQSKTLLCQLFNKIFVSHVIPSLWRKTIVKPIPKGSTIDPRVPLQYRGIALLSTVYKLYSAVLNNRIVKYCESEKLIHEE
jgi:hypothetical protein